jgi:hypothetical protein
VWVRRASALHPVLVLALLVLALHPELELARREPAVVRASALALPVAASNR